MRINHPIPPLFDCTSKILILGSFPSVKSREEQFFYGHKQNRFWRVISVLYGETPPQTIEEKRALLLRCHIALWDVIASCEITGSADSSIRDVMPNDLTPILSRAPIRAIYCNGRTAHNLYERHLYPMTQRPAQYLPSTSPANASLSLEQLTDAWRIILG